MDKFSKFNSEILVNIMFYHDTDIDIVVKHFLDYLLDHVINSNKNDRP